jgi:hypothetical protein
MKKFYWILVMATLLAANTSRATDEQRKCGSSRGRWIEHQLRNENYELSSSEQEGLYFCSVDSQRVVEVQFERRFVTIIFDPGAPLFFRQIFPQQNRLRAAVAALGILATENQISERTVESEPK